MSGFLHPTGIATTLFILGLLAESWYSWRFLRRLKTYPELWEHSGYRSLTTDGNLIGAWETIRYLKDRDYLNRNVEEEILFCEAYRIPVMASYFLAMISVALFFIAIIIFDWPPEWS